MKRKYPDSEIFTALQSSRPTANATFVDALKQKLLIEAEEVLVGPNVSRLTLILISMRRYSFAYITGLLLIAFTSTLLLSQGMDANEVLAKASENYNETEGIFYEKTLHQRYESGILQESSLEENYYDENGNHLWIVRNPDTNQIVKTSMETANPETGEGHSYETPNDTNESSEPEITEWYDTYSDSSKIYCVKIQELEQEIIKIFLKIAKDNPTVYAIDGVGEGKSINIDSVTAKDSLIEIARSKDYDYSTQTEDGEDYYVFERDSEDETGRHIAYYFNADTYRLDKELITFQDDPNREERNVYLESKTLDASEAENIFDPSKYNVVEIGMISAGGPHYITENGCYFEGEKMTEEETEKLLNTVPEEAITQWEDMFEEVTNPSEPSNEEIISFSESAEAIIDPNFQLLLPTTGAVTQSFHAGHPAIDWANKDKPDVLAAAEGTVVYVSTGAYEGGYGNNLWIEHENGFRTHYAHLGEITVTEGQTVSQGGVIGTMGNTGRVYGVTGIFLHFELEHNGEKIDPWSYIMQ